MVDKKSKLFNLRLFSPVSENGADPYDVVEALVGHYVKFDVVLNRYGYQSQKFELVNEPVVVPPEVAVAANVIMQVIEQDDALKDYNAKYNFVETLRTVIDIEPGYHLVRIATEIYLINALKNITIGYDYTTLYRAAITSRGYLLPAKTKFSKMFFNTTRVRNISALSGDRDLLLALDVVSEEEFSPTKNMYIKLSSLAKYIVDERRGLINEKDKNSPSNLLSSIRAELSGLL